MNPWRPRSETHPFKVKFWVCSDCCIEIHWRITCTSFFEKLFNANISLRESQSHFKESIQVSHAYQICKNTGLKKEHCRRLWRSWQISALSISNINYQSLPLLITFTLSFLLLAEISGLVSLCWWISVDLLQTLPLIWSLSLSTTSTFTFNHFHFYLQHQSQLPDFKDSTIGSHTLIGNI